MARRGDLVPVTMVKEFAWCPTIPWIIYNYGIEPPITPSMAIGIEFQRSADRLGITEKLGLEPPIDYQVYLEDRDLGLYGVADIIAGRKRKVMVEVKAFRRSIRRVEHFKIQLYTYALLAVRHRLRVERAIMLLGDQILDIPITSYSLDHVRKVVEKLRKVIYSPEPPTVSQDLNKCSYCRYRRFCPSISLC